MAMHPSRSTPARMVDSLWIIHALKALLLVTGEGQGPACPWTLLPTGRMYGHTYVPHLLGPSSHIRHLPTFAAISLILSISDVDRLCDPGDPRSTSISGKHGWPYIRSAPRSPLKAASCTTPHSRPTPCSSSSLIRISGAINAAQGPSSPAESMYGHTYVGRRPLSSFTSSTAPIFATHRPLHRRNQWTERCRYPSSAQVRWAAASHRSPHRPVTGCCSWMLGRAQRRAP